MPAENPTEKPEFQLPPGAPPVGGRYAWYVLCVLVIVYVFNFIDRGILSILAEDIKADLGVTDDQIAFLYGTAFAVFYAVFGIPLARLADLWTRRKIISIGLFFWSAMTALSGTAIGFKTLAAYRIGVGVGESSASPAAFSMLSDYFPPRMRATAMAIYSSGVYIGAGLGLFLGGGVLDWWKSTYPDPTQAPFQLVGWQAAFFVVGLPGLLMAVWVWTLKEPVRGGAEGRIAPEPKDSPITVLLREIGSIIPPFSIFALGKEAGGKATRMNVAILAALCAAAWGLTEALGSPQQWWVLAIGLYCVATWIQSVSARDHATYAMIFKSKSIVFAMLGFSCLAFTTYGIGFWLPPLYMRLHEVSPGTIGLYIGLGSAAGGWIGVTGGGILSDWLKVRTPKARVYCGYITALFSLPISIYMIMTDNVTMGYIAIFFATMVSSMWIGSAVALTSELVMPRMRATSSSFYIFMMTFVGLGLGPYAVGRMSFGFEMGGASSADALQDAMLYSLGVHGLAIVFLALSGLYVVNEEKELLDRARAAGEEIG